MTYKQKKAAARARIMEALERLEAFPVSWGELADTTAEFERIARRFGLVRELRENGVI